MSTYVKLSVCRRLDNRLEGLDNRIAHGLSSYTCSVPVPCTTSLMSIQHGKLAPGATRMTSNPAEWVELWVKLQEAGAALAPVAVPALLYVGKVLLDKGIETVVVDGVKWLLAKIKKEQDEGRIRDGEITVADQTTITCHPDVGIAIKLSTRVSRPYNTARDQVHGLEIGTETTNVPAALAPLVRQLIAASYRAKSEIT